MLHICNIAVSTAAARGHSLYGIDTLDSTPYDLVINVCEMEVECAVEIICHTASKSP
jgi:cytidylate kinase